MDMPSADVSDYFDRLRSFQSELGVPIRDVRRESPAAALDSLRSAVRQAPRDYRDYLEEAVACYEGGQFRAAILMVWSATMQHLYMVAAGHRGGVAAFETANSARYGGTRAYRQIKKSDDFLYLSDAQFLQLAEDAGMINRNARKMLVEQRLDLRNKCGHPTRYKPGRGEAVVFIESLLLNVIGGSMVNW